MSTIKRENVEAPEDLQQASDDAALQRAVDDAERDLADGKWIENSDMLVKLKQWAGAVPGDESPG